MSLNHLGRKTHHVTGLFSFFAFGVFGCYVLYAQDQYTCTYNEGSGTPFCPGDSPVPCAEYDCLEWIETFGGTSAPPCTFDLDFDVETYSYWVSTNIIADSWQVCYTSTNSDSDSCAVNYQSCESLNLYPYTGDDICLNVCPNRLTWWSCAAGLTNCNLGDDGPGN